MPIDRQELEGTKSSLSDLLLQVKKRLGPTDVAEAQRYLEFSEYGLALESCVGAYRYANRPIPSDVGQAISELARKMDIDADRLLGGSWSW